MIVQDDFRRQFYEQIKKEHILIIVNADVDALCAAEILTNILSGDELTYSLTPVDSLGALKTAIKIHGEQAGSIIFINCIGAYSLLEINIPEAVTAWVIESKRPIHLDNIYNSDLIKIIAHNSEIAEWQIPDAMAIYDQEGSSDGENDDEDDVEDDYHTDDVDGEGSIEDDDDDADRTGDEDEYQENILQGKKRKPKRQNPDGNQQRKRRRREELASIIGRRALRRQQKAQWKRTRGALLWEYYMKSWYAQPVSLFMLELAHELGKSTAELMWCAAIGISSQYMDNLISLEKYTEICADRIRPFIRKFGLRAGMSIEQTRNQLKISFNKELIIPLYAHWTLYDSMSNESVYICKSKLWSQRGEDSFKELLSQLGLTLAECHQNYDVMKRERRQEVFEILMKDLDTGLASFKSHLGYNTSYNAFDFARVLSLQLEYKQPKRNHNISQNDDGSDELCQRFESANRILREFFKSGGREQTPLGRAIEHYKLALQNLNEVLKKSIVQKHVVLRSRYFLLTLSEQCQILNYFSSRHFLNLFTHSMLRAYASQAKTSRRTKPFIVAIPLMDDNIGWHLITGVMPLAELMADSSRKNIIGSAFRHIAKETNMEISYTLDPNVVMIKSLDRYRFFNNLDARLESI